MAPNQMRRKTSPQAAVQRTTTCSGGRFGDVVAGIERGGARGDKVRTFEGRVSARGRTPRPDHSL